MPWIMTVGFNITVLVTLVLAIYIVYPCRASQFDLPLLSSRFVQVQAPDKPLLQNVGKLPFSAASRQAVVGDGYGGQGYTVLPVLREEEPATAILVHGLGGTGEEWGFVSLALSFFSLNYVKFIIPTAPTRSVTYLNQTLPSWYDIFFIGDFRATLNRTQLLASVARIDNIIAGEVSLGVDPRRIFLIGFSQGGGVALTSFLRNPFDLGGCIGVATWLPLDNEYPAQLSTNVSDKQILLMHGTEDTAVPLPYAVQSANRINNFGQPFNLTANLTRLIGAGHLLVTPTVMNALEEYINRRAPGTVRFLIKLVQNLTDTFAGINKRMEMNFLKEELSSEKTS